jgi:hypothetical protein
VRALLLRVLLVQPDPWTSISPRVASGCCAVRREGALSWRSPDAPSTSKDPVYVSYLSWVQELASRHPLSAGTVIVLLVLAAAVAAWKAYLKFRTRTVPSQSSDRVQLRRLDLGYRLESTRLKHEGKQQRHERNMAWMSLLLSRPPARGNEPKEPSRQLPPGGSAGE